MKRYGKVLRHTLIYGVSPTQNPTLEMPPAYVTDPFNVQIDRIFTVDNRAVNYVLMSAYDYPKPELLRKDLTKIIRPGELHPPGALKISMNVALHCLAC